MDINELYHYGVGHDKGGHSGRYPWGSGKNGKLSAYKKKKAQKLAEKYAKITGKKLVVKKVSTNNQIDKPKQKTVSEMTNQELQEKINRINLENTYKKLTEPRVGEKQSLGKSIKTRLKQQKDEVLWPSITDAGRQTLTQFLKDKGRDFLNGLKPGDPNASLRNQVATKELEARLAVAMNKIKKNGMSDKEWNKTQKNNFNNIIAKKATNKLVNNIINKANSGSSKRYTGNILNKIGNNTSSSVLSSTHKYTAAKTATRNTIKNIMKNNDRMLNISKDRSKLFSTIEKNNYTNQEIVYKAMKSFNERYKNYNPVHKNYNIRGFKTM